MVMSPEPKVVETQCPQSIFKDDRHEWINDETRILWLRWCAKCGRVEVLEAHMPRTGHGHADFTTIAVGQRLQRGR